MDGVPVLKQISLFGAFADVFGAQTKIRYEVHAILFLRQAESYVYVRFDNLIWNFSGHGDLWPLTGGDIYIPKRTAAKCL